MNNTDWDILLKSSDIFRSYVNNELAKEQANLKTAEEITTENLQIMDDFEEFQLKVNASPKLRESFKKLQNIFMTNPEYTAKADPKFVDGVLLLKLEG